MGGAGLEPYSWEQAKGSERSDGGERMDPRSPLSGADSATRSVPLARAGLQLTDGPGLGAGSAAEVAARGSEAKAGTRLARGRSHAVTVGVSL